MLRVGHTLRCLLSHHLVKVHQIVQFGYIAHQLLHVYVRHGELLLLLLLLLLRLVASTPTGLLVSVMLHSGSRKTGVKKAIEVVSELYFLKLYID